MAKKYKITLNSGGVRELLKSEAVASKCMKLASETAARAGEGFEAEPRNYPERSGAAAFPATDAAYYNNLHHNTLLKAVRSE